MRQPRTRRLPEGEVMSSLARSRQPAKPLIVSCSSNRDGDVNKGGQHCHLIIKQHCMRWA